MGDTLGQWPQQYHKQQVCGSWQCDIVMAAAADNTGRVAHICMAPSSSTKLKAHVQGASSSPLLVSYSSCQERRPQTNTVYCLASMRAIDTVSSGVLLLPLCSRHSLQHQGAGSVAPRLLRQQTTKALCSNIVCTHAHTQTRTQRHAHAHAHTHSHISPTHTHTHTRT
jgi:hypothetical protein